MRRVTFLFIFVSFLSGCATIVGTRTDFYPWQGDGIYQGDGGAVESVDGIEFWSIGEPNRPFKVIGYVTQSAKEGIGYNLVFGSLNRNELVKKVKENDGSGLIKISSQKITTGIKGSYDDATNSFSARSQIRKNDALAVFRYVDSSLKVGE